MKLRKLHIEDYKMFKDFDISFVDKDDEALPIVILAGVNGSGKTSLLEFISQCAFENELEKNFIEVDTVNIYENISLTRVLSRDKYSLNIEKNGVNSEIIYLQTYTNLDDIKTFLPKYIESMVYDKGIAPFDAYKEVRKYINIIFKDLDTQIEFDSRDGEGNLFFRNKKGREKFSIDKLSTGEKILMSKVLYLYLEDINNKVILIDEPELSLHPSWQNKVLKIYENFAKQNNCQIIIATHSPHIIGSAKPEYIRLLKKEDNKIVAIDNIDRSYGLEFNKILTDIMGAETRVSDVSERLSKIKSIIIKNDFDSDEFKEIWSDLENLIGADNIDLRLLKLEIASRKKNIYPKLREL